MLTLSKRDTDGPALPTQQGMAGPPSAVPRTPRWVSWAWTLAVAGFGGALAFRRLTFPGSIVFDEFYYTPEANDLLRHRVEWNHATGAADFVVHPPLGKWCIALGVLVFGDKPLGWRAPAVAAGVIAVIVLMRLTLRLFGSLPLAVIAGLLMTFDGMHFVISRTGILDIFLMTFLLASFACLVFDRDWAGRGRPWRLAAAALAGMAMAVKWSALNYIIVFVLLIFAWAYLAKTRSVRREILSLFGFAAVTTLTYLAAWTGYFATGTGWRRHWLATRGLPEWPVVGPVLNLVRYQLDVLLFHIGLDAPHRYQSQPWEWLLMSRPVLFWWSNAGPCGAPRCDNEILLLGTPLLWWSFIPALGFVAWLALRRRDWRSWAVFAGAAAGVVPWLPLPDRTKFLFYALPAEPFLILAVIMVLSRIVAPHLSRERRANGYILGFGYLAAVALCFAYFYPLYTATRLTHEQWWARLWWLGQHWV
jgi:dolichyl-phosphate-mannose-protein mannosyltransferase